jgi:hypothetical protein
MPLFEHGVGLTDAGSGAEKDAEATASSWFVTPSASKHLFSRWPLIVNAFSFVHR